MGNPIRRFFESIVFAGMQPGRRRQPSKRTGWFGRLRDRIDLFISGGRPLDPLYLSNRTWGQRLRLAAVIAVPCLITAGTIALFLTGAFRPKAPPPRELTTAEILAKVLPDLENTVKIEGNPDAEVTSMRVQREGPPRLVGILRNKASRTISVDLVVDFVNSQGSHTGSDTCRIDKAPAGGSTDFSCPVRIAGAVYAVVREIRTVE